MGLGTLVQHHQYIISAATTFLACIGLPLPISLVLLVAGAAAHGGDIRLIYLLPVVWLAAAAGDTILFLGGRYSGWWLLAWLCRLSTNPEQCIFRSADYFYRRGTGTLLFAKFIPGLGTMAAPLAGSLNMRPGRFMRLAFVGAIIYTSAWILAGYLFSPFIHVIEHWVEGAGHVVLMLVLAGVAAYAVSWLWFAVRARRFSAIQRVPAADLHQRLQTEDPDRLVVIADVRSHGYYDPGMRRIKNSIRVEPNRLEEELIALREFMAPECEIYLYCSCVREATSVRVAFLMNQQNCQTKVIKGGLRAWIKAGGALEPVPETEIQRLPQFD
jgi:membrane protein DedA with SNARE-associated domain/rhodanese-related sulfurtransferase